MAQFVNVVCPACEGSGSCGNYGCTYCMTQGHIGVNRSEDGTVPAGLQEWIDAEFAPIPNNPLTLRSEAVRASTT